MLLFIFVCNSAQSVLLKSKIIFLKLGALDHRHRYYVYALHFNLRNCISNPFNTIFLIKTNFHKFLFFLYFNFKQLNQETDSNAPCKSSNISIRVRVFPVKCVFA